MASKNLMANPHTTIQNLSPAQVRAREKVKKLIKEQGTKPLTISELRAMGEVWPEDESVDEFLAWREERRKSLKARRLA